MILYALNLKGVPKEPLLSSYPYHPQILLSLLIVFVSRKDTSLDGDGGSEARSWGSGGSEFRGATFFA